MTDLRSWMTRTYLNRKIRIEVLERDQLKCTNCGAIENLDVHHILPSRMGGSDDLQNLITLCKKCHRSIEKPNKMYSTTIVETDQTLIPMSIETRRRLRDLPTKSKTYDKQINEIIDFWEVRNQNGK